MILTGRRVSGPEAYFMGLADRLGTLEPGKRADLVLLEEASFAQVPYRPGHDPVVATIVAGEIAHRRDRRSSRVD